MSGVIARCGLHLGTGRVSGQLHSLTALHLEKEPEWAHSRSWAFWRKFETLPSLGIEPRLSILQPFQLVRRTLNETRVRSGGEETEREQLL